MCTPELKNCIERGYVVRITELGVYHGSKTLFTEYVDFFYGKRFEYYDAGNDAFASMSKLFLNALYGKFGQLAYDWIECKTPEELGNAFAAGATPGRVGVLVDPETGKKSTYRNLMGTVWRRSDEKVEPPEGFAAIAAHATSYARAYLFELIEEVGGREHVFYCDTDSMFMDEFAARQLLETGRIDQRELGKLKFESHMKKTYGTPDWEEGLPAPSPYGIFLCPKGYFVDGKGWKRKGIRKGSEHVDGLGFLMTIFEGAGSRLRNGRPDGARTKEGYRNPTFEYNKGIINEDGTIKPFYDVEESLEDPMDVAIPDTVPAEFLDVN